MKQTSSHVPNGKFPSYYFSLEHQTSQRRTFFFNPCNTAAAIHSWVQVHRKWLARGFFLDLTAYPSLSFIVTFPFSFQLLLCFNFYFFLLTRQEWLELSYHFQSPEKKRPQHWQSWGTEPMPETEHFLNSQHHKGKKIPVCLNYHFAEFPVTCSWTNLYTDVPSLRSNSRPNATKAFAQWLH